MIIDITQDHIERGFKANCRLCPIALAVRKYKDDLKVRTDHLVISDCFGGDQIICQLPIEARRFIRVFDNSRYYSPMKPFSFHLSAECFMP